MLQIVKHEYMIYVGGMMVVFWGMMGVSVRGRPGAHMMMMMMKVMASYT